MLWCIMWYISFRRMINISLEGSLRNKASLREMVKSFLGTPSMPSSRHPINTFDMLRAVKYTFSHSSAMRLPKNDLSRVLMKHLCSVLRSMCFFSHKPTRDVHQEGKLLCSLLLSKRERHATRVKYRIYWERWLRILSWTDPLINLSEEEKPAKFFGKWLWIITDAKESSLLTSFLFYFSCASLRLYKKRVEVFVFLNELLILKVYYTKQCI